MKPKKILSRFRRLYWGRFLFRCAVLIVTLALYFAAPGQFQVLSGFDCFRRFSFFHVMWVLWMVDMVLQLVPCRRYWPLGSQKFLKSAFQPLKDYRERTRGEGLVRFIYESKKDALRVAAVWLLLTAAIAVLYFTGIVDRNALLVFTVIFYVCDLICVLFWCPFRVWFMKNRCCTTCRIFNWDHLMMFTPLFFIPGVYTWSLCLMSLAVFLVWEITFSLHPERFWEGTNEALRCSNCTDRLCSSRNCRIDMADYKNPGRTI
ncbi:MAG: hypothetical protein ACI4PC_06400 [Oscillospiraceae bacterium]